MSIMECPRTGVMAAEKRPSRLGYTGTQYPHTGSPFRFERILLEEEARAAGGQADFSLIGMGASRVEGERPFV